MSDNMDNKLIISKVRHFKNGQRVVTIPKEDTTLTAGDVVKIERVVKVN